MINSNCSGPSAALDDFKVHFGIVYKYLALFICFFGVITNMLNVIVLNHSSMRSVTNFLLTSLALCNGLLMALYIPFDAYFLIGGMLSSCSQAWANYLLVYIIVQNILHAFSSWLTVVLALFRWIYIRFPIRSREWCSQQQVNRVISGVLLKSVLVSIPYMLAHSVEEVYSEPLKNETKNEKKLSKNFTVEITQNIILRRLLFWVMAIWIKLVPVLLLSLLSSLLIMELRKAKCRRTNLKKSSNKEEEKKNQRSARTTKMLMTIVMLFIVAFLPQALLLLLDGALICFEKNVSQPLGDLTDLMTLLNCSVTFILYCSMSKQFRDTFKKLLLDSLQRRINTLRASNYPTAQNNSSNLEMENIFSCNRYEAIQPCDTD